MGKPASGGGGGANGRSRASGGGGTAAATANRQRLISEASADVERRKGVLRTQADLVVSTERRFGYMVTLANNIKKGKAPFSYTPRERAEKIDQGRMARKQIIAMRRVLQKRRIELKAAEDGLKEFQA